MKAGFCGKHAGTGVCLNIPSRYLHWNVSEHFFLAYVLRRAVSLLCEIFAPNSGYIARYAPFFGTKLPQIVTHICRKAIFRHVPVPACLVQALCQRQEAPHGRTSPLSVTGRPISSAVTEPPKSWAITV